MTGYPDGMTLRPIVSWPGVLTVDRKRAPFSATLGSTLQQLDRELGHLGKGRLIAPSVLQIAMCEQDFRIDGLPRANARPDHPGVILSVESRKGALSFPCDRFTTWQDNLRAITLGLEALRRIERYGITPNSEQYTGWLALETRSSAMGVVEAEQFIRDTAEATRTTSLKDAYRAARARSHPDRHKDDRQFWDDVEAAADILRAAGRLS